MPKIEKQSEAQKKAFAKDYAKWLNGIPEENRDWAEALIAAAMDHARGNLEEALAMAKKGYAEDPTGAG